MVLVALLVFGVTESPAEKERPRLATNRYSTKRTSDKTFCSGIAATQVGLAKGVP